MTTLFCALLLSGVANAAIIFSDLGTGSSVYTADQAEIGAEGSGVGPSPEHASLFTASGVGVFNVTQIDLGVAQATGDAGTFTASLWTNSGGVPGTELGSWNMSTTNPEFTCCALATQTGITGVSLTGGVQYFLVIAPQVPGDSSKVYWQSNSFGLTHTALGSINGGASWLSAPNANLEAYDVIGDPVSTAPEPGSWCLLGAGLIIGFVKRKTAQTGQQSR
jgi:hypothetical protein